MVKPSTAISAVLFSSALAIVFPPKLCPPLNGNFTLNLSNVYPESGDFDLENCKIYVSSTGNNTVVEFDPYTKTTKIITFPGISGNDEYMISGVDYSHNSGRLYFSANARAAFYTGGVNLTGPNNLIQYDPLKNNVVHNTDLQRVISQIEKKIGEQIGGFQDHAEDTLGNSYYMSTWGNVIITVDCEGRASPFYIPPVNQRNDSSPGFGGLFSSGETLVVTDALSGSFVVFDLGSPKSEPSHSYPTNLPSGYKPLLCDSLYAPSKYGGSIAICADDFAFGVGGISVYRSKDNWKTSKYLGFIYNDYTQVSSGTATATFEAAGSIYAVIAFIPDATGKIPQVSNFPIIDITQRVEDLVSLS